MFYHNLLKCFIFEMFRYIIAMQVKHTRDETCCAHPDENCIPERWHFQLSAYNERAVLSIHIHTFKNNTEREVSNFM